MSPDHDPLPEFSGPPFLKNDWPVRENGLPPCSSERTDRQSLMFGIGARLQGLIRKPRAESGSPERLGFPEAQGLGLRRGAAESRTSRPGGFPEAGFWRSDPIRLRNTA